MSNTNLIQIKVNKEFRAKLEDIASEYDLPVSSFIKVVIGDFIRNKRTNILTENGFSKKEEQRILDSINITNKDIKNKKVNIINTKDFISSLND